MRDFLCPSCGQHLTFENSQCLGCHSELGYDVGNGTMHVLDGPNPSDDQARRRCANFELDGCNWIAANDSSAGLCVSCALTRTRPSFDDKEASPAFALAEAAKRRLVAELVELGLPIQPRDVHGSQGFCFDLLSSSHQPVTTGHIDGVITLDLAEGDDLYREQQRLLLDEPYRTVLGHFRHETGHY